MKPSRMLKRDPMHHPVRFLAGIWEERTGTQLSDKEFGQLKSLKKFLGDLTQHVVEWMVDPANWWRYSQQVRAQGKMYRVPPEPQIGFLLKHRNRALKIMRRELRNSTAPTDVAFCTRLDRLDYERWKALLLVMSGGKSEQLAKIEAAKR